MQPTPTDLNTINVQLSRPLAQRILTSLEMLSQSTTAERPEFDALREAIKTGFEHARKVATTASIQEVATAQSELVKSQIAGAEHHIRELARATGSKARPEF